MGCYSSTAIPILFSEAPNRVKSRILSEKKTAIRIMLVIRVNVIPLPIDRWAFCISFFPWQMFKQAAHLSPKHHAKACAIMKMGKITPVAALPRALSPLLLKLNRQRPARSLLRRSFQSPQYLHRQPDCPQRRISWRRYTHCGRFRP